MTTGISVLPYTTTGYLHFRTSKTSLSFTNSKLRSPLITISSHFQILSGRVFHSLKTVNCTKRNKAVCNSLQPGAPSPSGSPPPPGSWKKWILGLLIAILLPLLWSRWRPVLKLNGVVETAVGTAEHVIDVVEKVAEKVGKVADVVAGQLPEGGKLKELATSVEDVAKETAKDAQLAEDAIDKVQEVGKEMESIIDPAADEAKSLKAKIKSPNK